MAAAAKKLLDDLMGSTRDVNLDEAKAMKGKNFMQKNVCKHYLCGFCPLLELCDSKKASKRKIKECKMVHSDAMKNEFDSAPDKEKLQKEYEKGMLPLMESLIREADQWGHREKASITRVVGDKEEVTVNNMTPEIEEAYNQMKNDLNKMMAAAELEADQGNVEGSQFKVMLADEIKAKVNEHEKEYIVTKTVTCKGEEVCDVCGTRYEALNAGNHARYQAHFTGKVHLGYVKIREWIEKLKKSDAEKMVDRKEGDNPEGSERRNRSGSRKKDDRNRRSRSRGRRDDERRRSRSRGRRDDDRRGDRGDPRDRRR